MGRVIAKGISREVTFKLRPKDKGHIQIYDTNSLDGGNDAMQLARCCGDGGEG